MLFKTTDELRDFIPVDREFDINELATYLQRAESSVLIPYISQTQYDDLHTAYQNNSTLTNPQTELLKRSRQVITPLAVLYWVPVGQVHISSAGIRILTSTDAKTAFQWQIDDIKNELNKTGYNALEQLIEYLETNIGSYSLYAASSAHTTAKQFFVNNTKDFSKYFQIKDSRLFYNAMLPIMKRVEDLIVKGSLSSALFDEIKTQILANNLTANNNTLMKWIQPATVHLTIAKAIDEKAVTVDEQGVSLLTQGVFLTAQGKSPATEERLAALYKSERQAGENYLKDLRDYLNANASATVYPLYFSSDNYIDPDEETEGFENDETWGTVGFW